MKYEKIKYSPIVKQFELFVMKLILNSLCQKAQAYVKETNGNNTTVDTRHDRTSNKRERSFCQEPHGFQGTLLSFS